MNSWTDVVYWFGNSSNLGTILTLATTAICVIALVLGVTLSVGRVGKRVRAAHEDLNDRLDALNRTNADIARALRDVAASAPAAPAFTTPAPSSSSAQAPASAPAAAGTPAPVASAAPAPAAAPLSRAELRATTVPESPTSGSMPSPAAQAHLVASSLDNDPLNQ